jgi:hypothetical protein
VDPPRRRAVEIPLPRGSGSGTRLLGDGIVERDRRRLAIGVAENPEIEILGRALERRAAGLDDLGRISGEKIEHGPCLEQEDARVPVEAACVEILLVYLFNDMWLCKAKQIIIAFEIRRPIFESFATIILFGKFITLYHGAHSTIDDEDAFFEFVFNIHIQGFEL